VFVLKSRFFLNSFCYVTPVFPTFLLAVVHRLIICVLEYFLRRLYLLKHFPWLMMVLICCRKRML